MITQKTVPLLFEPKCPVKEIQKKEIARAECAFFGRRKHARESPPRARGDGNDDNTYHKHPYDKSKSDLKKPSEPEEKERGRESFFCILGKVLSGYRERERERERERNENFGDDVITLNMIC
jgi:hypothetical protein